MIRILCLAPLLASCAATAAEPPFLPLTARGQEPGWLLSASSEGISLSLQSGESLSAPLPAPERLGPAVRYTTPAIAFEVRPGLCHDTMSGMPYPLSVTLLGEPPREGCGGEPAELLAGDWTVAEVDGAAAPGDVTLSVEPGRIAGNSGCNRFSAPLEMTGEGIALGPAVATRMACPDPAMQFESRFLSALERIDRFDIDADGRLLLIAADRPMVIARR